MVAFEEFLQALTRLKVVDLTHSIESEIPLLPFQEPISYENLVDYEQGALVRRFTLDEHQGTHADAPAHFVPGGMTIAQIPEECLVTRGYLVDVREKVAADPNHALSVEDVLEAEKAWGAGLSGGFLVAHTGWSRHWPDPKTYYGLDAQGGAHFPGFSVEVVDFLRHEREIVGIGIDGPSVDCGVAGDYPVHHHGLKAGLIFVENLTRLDRVQGPEFGIVVAPLKLTDGSGAPARVFGLTPAGG